MSNITQNGITVMEADQEYLANIWRGWHPKPQEADAEAVRHLFNSLESAYFPAGTEILRAGDPADRLLFIRAGLCGLFLPNDQAEPTVTPSGLSVIGESDFFRNLPWSFHLKALSDCEAGILPRVAFAPLPAELRIPARFGNAPSAWQPEMLTPPPAPVRGLVLRRLERVWRLHWRPVAGVEAYQVMVRSRMSEMWRVLLEVVAPADQVEFPPLYPGNAWLAVRPRRAGYYGAPDEALYVNG